jgi:RNA polymerase sigma-70 factor (ECF subfamily)
VNIARELPPATEAALCANQRRDEVLTDYARSLIRYKARQLSRRTGFTRFDCEDLEQDLWLSLLKQIDQFDPKRASLNTFIDRVVNSSAAMILRDRCRRKRSAGFQTQSLDRTHVANSDEPIPLRSVISADDLSRRTGAASADETTRQEDEEAITAAIGVMPPKLRDVCRRLMGGNVLSVARDLKTSRRQIRSALAETRAYFVQAGFGDS